MFRIAICDGEATSLTLLRALTEKIMLEEEQDFSITTYRDSDVLLHEIRNGMFYHILLADVKNRSQGGFSVAEELHRQNAPTAVVFLAWNGKYAMDAFRMEITRYLCKPVSMGSLREALVSAYKRTILRTRLPVTVSGRRWYIPYRDIYYVEADEAHSVIHLRNGEIAAEEGMGQIGEILPESRFVASSAYHLVNLRHIGMVGRGKVTMTNGDELLLARSRQQKVLDMFLSFS